MSQSIIGTTWGGKFSLCFLERLVPIDEEKPGNQVWFGSLVPATGCYILVNKAESKTANFGVGEIENAISPQLMGRFVQVTTQNL